MDLLRDTSIIFLSHSSAWYRFLMTTTAIVQINAKAPTPSIIGPTISRALKPIDEYPGQLAITVITKPMITMPTKMTAKMMTHGWKRGAGVRLAMRPCDAAVPVLYPEYTDWCSEPADRPKYAADIVMIWKFSRLQCRLGFHTILKHNNALLLYEVGQI